jgi:hypothetical protein
MSITVVTSQNTGHYLTVLLILDIYTKYRGTEKDEVWAAKREKETRFQKLIFVLVSICQMLCALLHEAQTDIQNVSNSKIKAWIEIRIFMPQFNTWTSTLSYVTLHRNAFPGCKLVKMAVECGICLINTHRKTKENSIIKFTYLLLRTQWKRK